MSKNEPRWYERQRMMWIADVLRIFGFINRKHLQFMFGVSANQAYLDLKSYMAANPGSMSYNKSLKRYVASPVASPSSTT